MNNNYISILAKSSGFPPFISFIFAALISVVSPVYTYAAEPITIVITGSNIPADEQLSINSSYIINKEEIKKQSPRTVSQLLQMVPGMYVENASGRGALNTVYLRGAEPNYTLVMIDGVKVNDPSNSRGGAFDFSMLDINSVERIEVVKGSFSSIYGSDAMAGVINIVTLKDGDAAKTAARIELGSREQFNARVSTNSRFDKGNIALAVAYADDGKQIKSSEFRARSVNANGGYDFSDTTNMSVNAYFQDADTTSYPDASGGDKYAVLRDLDQIETTQQHYVMKLDHQMPMQDNLHFQYSYFRNEEMFVSPGIDLAIPAYNTDTDYQRQQLQFTYLVRSHKKLDASIGLEIEKEKGTSTGTIDPGGFNIPTDFQLDRNLYATFAEVQYHLADNLLLAAGLRVDVPEDRDTEASPRAGISYRSNATTYRANWGEGYKLPSFFAQAHPIVGNPDFKPETSESYEVGMQHDYSESRMISATLFRQTYFDLIDFDESGVLVQRSEVITKGIEIRFTGRLSSQLQLQLHYTALNFDIKNSNDSILKRPDRTAGLDLSWKMNPQVVVTGRASYIGAIKDFAYPTGERTLDSYIKVDAAMNWQWNETWLAQFAIDNMLDEHYQQSIGTSVPGIGLRVALQSRF